MNRQNGIIIRETIGLEKRLVKAGRSRCVTFAIQHDRVGILSFHYYSAKVHAVSKIPR